MRSARALLLAAVAALSGCASVYRPPPTANYHCVNTDVDFSVIYTWDPPRARLTLGADTVDLSPTPDNPVPRGHYAFGAVGGVQLEVEPNVVFLHRPGHRTLRCEEEVIIIV